MISEEEFVRQIEELAVVDWTIKISDSGVRYLVKSDHKVLHDDQVYNFEYHVARHPSYCVPVLCFHLWNSLGKTITDYDTVWSIFQAKLPKDFQDTTELHSALTQIDHPVLQTPIWAIHPCRTPALLENCSGSRNLVLTFLSTYGPFVGLTLDNFQLYSI